MSFKLGLLVYAQDSKFQLLNKLPNGHLPTEKLSSQLRLPQWKCEFGGLSWNESLFFSMVSILSLQVPVK